MDLSDQQRIKSLNTQISQVKGEIQQGERRAGNYLESAYEMSLSEDWDEGAAQGLVGDMAETYKKIQALRGILTELFRTLTLLPDPRDEIGV